MGRTVMLVENFFRTVQWAGHTVSASAEAAGHEAFRVGTDRRGGETYWTPPDGQEDTAHWLKVRTGRVRAADMIAIDRESNLAGKVCRLQVSQDNFTTYTEIAAITVPAQTFYASRLDEKPGVMTSEGAWLYRFRVHAGVDWRLYIDAMGAGLKPQITGLYLGLSHRLRVPRVKPFGYGKRQLSYSEMSSRTLWSSTADLAQRVSDDIGIRCEDWAEYDQLRYHIEEQFLRGYRMWLVHDDERAELSQLVFAPQGVAGFDVPQGRAFPEARIAFHEHEPALT